MKKFDIAISYSAEDSWLAKDLHSILSGTGFTVFTYDTSPDAAANTFSQSLLAIYKNAALNVLIWSESYKNSDKHSVVMAEMKALHSRHIGQSEQQSLVIIAVDNTPRPDDFDTCLMHKITVSGIVSLSTIILDRMMLNWRISSNNKFYQHPKGCKNRDSMTPCTFYIKNTYAGTSRWKTLGDIDVSINANSVHKNGMKVFLIPSGLTPPFVSHSVALKTNSKFLDIKKKIANDFIRQNLNTELDGVLFNINKDIALPHAYSRHFDKFILENWHNYVK